jgi:hypothetical protein
MLLRIEQAEWKPFRNTLDKIDRQTFDRMLNSAHQFNHAMMCAMPNIPVPFRLVLMAIVFGHYQKLSQLMIELKDYL